MTVRQRCLVLVLLALGILPAPRALGQVLSPGDLSRVHQAIEGDDHCLECHSSGKRVDTQRCTHCHGDIGRELQSQTGLHGKEYRTQACAECHIEHRGKQHDLVRWPDGAQSKFDHARSGWALVGAHEKVACQKCHTARNERGAPTFIGTKQTCSGCHKDPHEHRFGNECQKCHNEQTWKGTKLDAFDHALTRFPLQGAHAKVECKSCHGVAPNTQYHPPGFDTCTSCHKDPHQGRFSQVCTSCHTQVSWTDLHMQRDEHPRLSLSGGHAQVKCATCHDKGNDAPPSKGSRCVSCHAPIHEAPFGDDCAHCHKRIEWLGVSDALSLELHARTKFPLRGEHHDVSCEKCHLTKLPLNHRYRKLEFGRCNDCHADAHGGEFKARAASDCSECHDEHGFSPTLFGMDAHASTAFPLLGRHAAVACVGCHRAASELMRASSSRAGGAGAAAPNDAKASVSPSTKKHASAARRSSAGAPAPAPSSARLDWHIAEQRCADCHANPHGEQFATEMAGSGCAHCHSPNAWNVPNVDHSIWPLTGTHARAECASCHATSGASGKAQYRGVPRDCEGCHDDPHAGQFRLQPPLRGCTDCHDTRTFRVTEFDHAAKTGYALEGRHQAVPCIGCHRSESLHNGISAVRYRLTYQACADCHKNPHTAEVRP